MITGRTNDEAASTGKFVEETTQTEPQQPTPLEQRFKTLDDITGDPLFIDFVKENLRQQIAARQNRPKPKPGFHYKRDWYDRLDSENNLNAKYFIDHIALIWMKRSALSADIRYVIQVICDKSFQQTMKAYEKENQPINTDQK